METTHFLFSPNPFAFLSLLSFRLASNGELRKMMRGRSGPPLHGNGDDFRPCLSPLPELCVPFPALMTRFPVTCPSFYKCEEQSVSNPKLAREGRPLL